MKTRPPRKKKRPQHAPHAATAASARLSNAGSASQPWRQRLEGWVFPPLDRCDTRAAPDARPHWRYLWPLLGAALALRLALAVGGDFVLHPDEIMQYLEPAHQAVFGNGVLYWEYVYGARNWLIPGAVAVLLWLLDTLGLAQPAIYVNAVKIAFCLLSLLIPWGMYRCSQHLFGERSARLALLGGCFWYELIGFAHKPMQEFVATAVFILALALASNPAHRQGSTLSAAIIGFLCVLVGILRMQYAPLALVLLMVLALLQKPRILLAMLAGAGLSVVLVMSIEWATWGGVLHSYLLNMLVNLELDTLRRGESTALELLLRLTIASLGGVLLAGFAIALSPRRTLLLALLIALLLLLHSQFSHREYRFIYLCIPLWLMLATHALVALDNVMRATRAALIRKALAVLALTLGVAALLNQLPFQQWVHKAYSKESGIVNYLLHQDPLFDTFAYLAEQDDVAAVLILQAPYFNTPGYYYLHRDIPFYDYHQLQRISRDSKSSQQSTPIDEALLTQYVSHIVARREVLTTMQFQRYEAIAEFNAWRVMRRKDNRAAVAALTQHVIHPDYNTGFATIVQRVKATALYKSLAEQRLINPAVGSQLRLPLVGAATPAEGAE